MNKKYRGSFDRHLGMLFTAVLAVFLIVNILVPDRENSFTENRVLAGLPKPSAYTLASGTFADDFETYLSDQFAGRDTFRNAISFVLWVGGNREEHGVYSAPGGQLLEALKEPSEEVLAANIAFLNDTAAARGGKRTTVLLVPDAGAVLGHYPAFAVNADQAALFEQVKEGLSEGIGWVDTAAALKDSGVKKLYYKTDHHWTTAAAQAAYDSYCAAVGLTPGEFDFYTVSRSFNGQLSSISGFCMLERETIEIATPAEEESVVLTYTDEKKKKATLYDREKLTSSDQYAVFLGGNSSIIDISTTAKTDRSLLLVKDSFANCFIPFLTGNYSRIVVVDPRYVTGSLNSVLERYPTDDLLFLYSGNTFFENSISGQ